MTATTGTKVVLRSQGGRVVEVTDPRDRWFLEQADALVARMNAKLGRGSNESSTSGSRQVYPYPRWGRARASEGRSVGVQHCAVVAG